MSEQRSEKKIVRTDFPDVRRFRGKPSANIRLIRICCIFPSRNFHATFDLNVLFNVYFDTLRSVSTSLDSLFNPQLILETCEFHLDS